MQKGVMVKIEEDAVLSCSACGVEGRHELLYLSNHLAASRCLNCEETRVYSEHLYEDYVRDVVERTGHLPEKPIVKALKIPLSLAFWSLRVEKPLSMACEFGRLASFRNTVSPDEHNLSVTARSICPGSRVRFRIRKNNFSETIDRAGG